ncbi:hypothetical protein EYC84_010086 [Monilinia fructicola]|uniref:Uncharacterized protein n=1 Tax=Monilinia fructicola TaxID=38448 RepID=A0A5M9JE13_MONFR|nr:hypothetical protein EYC84_010086 [Monilinia fructicola]
MVFLASPRLLGKEKLRRRKTGVRSQDEGTARQHQQSTNKHLQIYCQGSPALSDILTDLTTPHCVVQNCNHDSSRLKAWIGGVDYGCDWLGAKIDALCVCCTEVLTGALDEL